MVETSLMIVCYPCVSYNPMLRNLVFGCSMNSLLVRLPQIILLRSSRRTMLPVFFVSFATLLPTKSFTYDYFTELRHNTATKVSLLFNHFFLLSQLVTRSHKFRCCCNGFLCCGCKHYFLVFFDLLEPNRWFCWCYCCWSWFSFFSGNVDDGDRCGWCDTADGDDL